MYTRTRVQAHAQRTLTQAHTCASAHVHTVTPTCMRAHVYTYKVVCTQAHSRSLRTNSHTRVRAHPAQEHSRTRPFASRHIRTLHTPMHACARSRKAHSAYMGTHAHPHVHSMHAQVHTLPHGCILMHCCVHTRSRPRPHTHARGQHSQGEPTSSHSHPRSPGANPPCSGTGHSPCHAEATGTPGCLIQ